MIAETVMDRTIPKIGSISTADLPGCVIYPVTGFRHSQGVLTTKELLARLRERDVKNADIARALNVTPSRVTELYNGERALKLDEAVKLVEAFALESEPSQRVAALPAPVAQLIVRHVAQQLGQPLEDDSPALQALGEDIRAFCEFVTDPAVRESIDLAMAFFQALRLRRPAPVEAG